MSQIFMVPGTYDENLAHVETGDVASRNYAAGEFLTWKGVLHSAKTAIITGETFVEDTNVQDESDGGLANALSSNIINKMKSAGNWKLLEVGDDLHDFDFVWGAKPEDNSSSIQHDWDNPTFLPVALILSFGTNMRGVYISRVTGSGYGYMTWNTSTGVISGLSGKFYGI